MIPDINKDLIEHMIEKSDECIKKYPKLHDHPFLCENIYLSPHQDKDSFDLHTHTIKGIDYPSAADLQTHQNIKKNHLCIINTIDRTLTCWKAKGDGSLVKSQRKIK